MFETQRSIFYDYFVDCQVAVVVVDNTIAMLKTEQIKLLTREFNFFDAALFARPLDSDADFVSRSLLPHGRVQQDKLWEQLQLMDKVVCGLSLFTSVPYENNKDDEQRGASYGKCGRYVV